MKSVKTQKLSSTKKMRARIEAFKAEVERAKQKGIDILPSVNGPYAYDSRTGVVLGRKGSEGYANAVK